MIVSIKRLMTWCTCVAKAKDRGRLSSLQSSSFLSSGTSSTLVFVKDGWELNFPLLDRFQVINRCKVAQFATLQQYVQGDGCMIQDCWSYLPKDWWVETEELFHLWSQDTEQSHLHLLYQPLFHLKWIYCSATLYNYTPFDPISSEEISKDLWVK